MRPHYPRNSRNLFHSHMPVGEGKVYESRVHFSRYARAERTLLPTAFDLDLDLDREGHEFHSCRISVQIRKLGFSRRGMGFRPPLPTPCHPERSMRSRFMNPHAQSKDPYPAARASALSGSSPGIAGPWGGQDREGHEFHSCHISRRGPGSIITRTWPPPSSNPAIASQTPARINRGSSTR
jgi:hypothetical protein